MDEAELAGLDPAVLKKLELEWTDAVAMLRHLQTTPQWRLLSGTIVGNAANIEKRLLGPLLAADGIYMQEYQKGLAQGLRRATTLPAEIVEAYEDQLKLLERFKKENLDDRTNSDDSEPSTDVSSGNGDARADLAP